MKKKSSQEDVVKKIESIAKEDVYEKIKKKKAPELKMLLRALSNVKYDPKDGFFELLGKMKERTLTASTIKTFAQTLRMMVLLVLTWNLSPLSLNLTAPTL